MNVPKMILAATINALIYICIVQGLLQSYNIVL
jgi:hypothetical protein